MFCKPDNEFYISAKKYCAYINDNEISIDRAEELLKMLLGLYQLGINLPDVDPDTIEETPHKKRSPEIRIAFPDAYWVVFDPAKEDVCLGSLSLDLHDIYMDLQDGIAEFDAQLYNNAVFEWKFGLTHHWGMHALNAIRLLHQIRTDGYFEAELS